ncbi:hypothetical protein HD592_000664 [Schaalia hyovaginalis]|uniref:Uncharacterized protein n=1 Tax=Schaalia hyovaginalis TaxID=29316 RepID=A0A923IYX5_9ACTO|nr:hypothetical protein [Schaalia hyovaginalis]
MFRSAQNQPLPVERCTALRDDARLQAVAQHPRGWGLLR